MRDMKPPWSPPCRLDVAPTFRRPTGMLFGLCCPASRMRTGRDRDMTKLGDRLVQAASEALAHARVENVPGMGVHEPTPAIDVRVVVAR